MVLRRVGLALIGLAAFASTTCLATLPDAGFAPLAALLSLLPLQGAALLWVLTTGPAASSRCLNAPRPPSARGD